MALNYISITETDASGGIDAASAENTTPASYCEDLVNGIPHYEGTIRKRPGYITYAGGVPLRVNSIESLAGNQMRIYLDPGVSPALARNTPLILAGRVSPTADSAFGDFSSTAVTYRYYPYIVSDPRRSVAPTSSANLQLLAGESNLTSTAALIQLTEATSLSNYSNTQVFAGGEIDGSYNVTVPVTNGTSDTKYFYVQLLDTAASSRPSYSAAKSGTTWTVSQADHSFPNLNIIGRCYDTSGASAVEVTPDSFSIAPNGTVTCTFSSSITGIIVLVDCETINSTFGTVADGATSTVTLNDLDTPWIFADCYLDNGSGTRTRVLPDSVTVDALTNTATVSFVNNSGVSATFFIYWTAVNVTSSIVVDCNTTCVAGTLDTSSSLVCYGLDSQEVFLPGIVGPRAGWVNHIDNYRTAIEEKLVCGSGGRFFAATPSTNAPVGSLMPTWFPAMRSKTILQDQIVGPAFATADTGRTRGCWVFPEANAGGTEGTALASKFEWDAGNSLMKVTVPTTGRVDPVTPPIDNYWDWLTILQAPYSQLVGTWRIRSFDTTDPDAIIFSIELSGVGLEIASSDFDIDNVGAIVGVFSDSLTFQNVSYVLPGDVLTSPIAPDTETIIVSDSRDITSTPNTTIMLNGFRTTQFYPLGVLLPFKRLNSTTFVLRKSDDADIAPGDLNLVRGDVVRFTGDDCNVRITHVHAEANTLRTVSIVPTGTAGEYTVSGIDATTVRIGNLLPILGGPFNGLFEVTNIVNDTSCTVEEFLRTTDASISPGGHAQATLAGHFIQTDLPIAVVEDFESNATEITVPDRWLPIDTPTDESYTGPFTYDSQLPAAVYDEMPLVRSVMANDSLFLQSGTDFPLKYDGSSIYRAGVLRWQPQIFVQTDTTSPFIVSDSALRTVFPTSGAGFICVTPGGASVYKEGDIVYCTYLGGISPSITTVTGVTRNTTAPGTPINCDIISVATSSTPDTVRKVALYRYYFRLNIVDANDKVIVSATTGYDDAYVLLTESSKVRFKLVGLPCYDAMDASRYELEVYRTKSSGTAPFYRVANVDVTFGDGGAGYILVDDITSDSQLTDASLDVPIVAMGGNNLLPGLEPMPQAKYLTTFQNRMITANLLSPYTAALRLALPTGSPSSLGGLRWLIRKDSASSATVSDMINAVGFEFKAASSDTITNIVPDAGLSFFTVTVNTGAAVAAGDWVYMYRGSAASTTANPRWAGWYQVRAQTGAKTFTVYGTFIPGGTWNGANDVDRICYPSNAGEVPVFLGTDYNYMDVAGNTDATTGIPFQVYLAARRLVNAINSVMRCVDIGNATYAAFRPWLMANGGGDYPPGTVEIRAPKYLSTIPEVVLPGPYNEATQLRIYGNGIKRDYGTSVGFIQSLYPSRVCMSFNNYPEIFDTPFAADADSSLSVMDVNPADGQEITGVIPMFGVSSYVLSQRSSVLVVFKERSIYVVSPDAKAAGENYLQRLETGGVGCTMPGSITLGKSGVYFANESGIYRLNYQLQVEYIGYKLERKWKSLVDLEESSLEVAVGHNYPKDQQYKLNFLDKTSQVAGNMWVYNYRREDKLVPDNNAVVGADRLGGWSRYTNIPAVGWANQRNEEFFASTLGRVFQTRTCNNATDYRDDASPVSFAYTTRANDFGDAGIRKMMKHILVSFRNATYAMSGTTLYSSINLNTASSGFRRMQSFTQATTAEKSIDFLRFSINPGRFQYLSLRIENATLDEACEISGITYRVAGLSDQRTVEATSKGRT